MSNAETTSDQIKVIVDGNEIGARTGEMLIQAAERNGTFIPRFCFHPRLPSVGMCRMCLVEVKGPRGFSLQPSCYLTVAPGMEVVTNSEKVKKAQDGVLEFLLINHPLDCPVCDKGGECPLQDQTLAYGPGESRFVEEKRHFEKPIALSELVYLDRERCIQCDRCTRFADQVARDPLINFVGRGDQTEVNTFPGGKFSSYFSGNTVQICPVGALTATPYRFKARPWDLSQVESTCTVCSVGCRIAVQFSRGEITRYLGIDSEAVNHSWLCDLGRFSYEALDSAARVLEPQVRYRSDLVAVSWRDAVARVTAQVKKFQKEHGATSIGFLGSATFSNEGIYSWVRLAKSIIGSDNFDADLSQSISANAVFEAPRATIDQAMGAKVLIVASADLREELPVLFLRLNEAAKAGIRIVEVSEVETSITPLAEVRLGLSQLEFARSLEKLGTSGADTALALMSEVLASAGISDGDGLAIVVGKSNIADSKAITDAIANLARKTWPMAKFVFSVARSNIFGAMDLGATPGHLPGRMLAGSGGAEGLSALGMLRKASSEPMLLFVLGQDPILEMADTALVTRALSNATVVVVDSFSNGADEFADVVLPLAAFGESQGTTTSFEGRVSRLGQALVPKGQSKPDYMIAAELARDLGQRFEDGNAEAIFANMVASLPLYAGLSYNDLGSPRFPDGVVVPLPRTKVSIGPSSKRLDPIATPGLLGPDRQGPPMSFDVQSEGEERSDMSEIAAFARADASSADVFVPRPEAADSHGLRLVLSRRLYSPSASLGAAPIMSRLIAPSELWLGPALMAELGIAEGSEVSLRGSNGEEVVALAHLDPALPDGIVRGLVGKGANLLALVNSDAVQSFVKVGTN